MIISFSVQNFRSIRDKVTLDFRATADKHQEEYFVVEIAKPKLRILRMAMLYGANASGKTSILMALDYLRKLVLFPVADKNKVLDLPSYALDKEKPSIFELEFFHQDVCYKYTVELVKSRILTEILEYFPKGYKSLVFHRRYDPEINTHKYKWSSAILKKTVRDQLELTIQNQTILSKIASIEDNGPLQEAHNWFRHKLDTLFSGQKNKKKMVLYRYLDNEERFNNFRKYVVDLLKFADFNISDLRYVKDKIDFDTVQPDDLERVYNQIIDYEEQRAITMRVFLQHIVKEGVFDLEIENESNGTQRFLEFCQVLYELLIFDAVMPIDEIECSLHDDLLFHFLRLFLKNSKHGQLLFTSHNTALLNEKDIIRRDCVWITDRKADGSTELTSVSDYPVRKEHAIDSLYRKGLLGGLPNLGSTNLENQR